MRKQIRAIMVDKEQFTQMISYKPLVDDRIGQKKIKKQLLEDVISFFGERYYRFKQETKDLLDFISWFASERGFFYASQEYLSSRHSVSERTIRSRMKELVEAGLVRIAYRRTRRCNGRGKPVYFFTQHHYFDYWNSIFHFEDFQTSFQTENTQTSTESKDEASKKIPTYSFTRLNKQEIKRPEVIELNDLDTSFTPFFVPESFKTDTSPFFQAKDIWKLWGKAMIVCKYPRLKPWALNVCRFNWHGTSHP